MNRLIPCALLLAGPLEATEPATRLKSDEQIVFYPTVAQRIPGPANEWSAPIRGCIFEPESRGITLATLRAGLALSDVEMSAAERELFNRRARLFLVDHERDKPVFIRLADKVHPAGESGEDGRFGNSIRFQPDSATNRVSFTAWLGPTSTRVLPGDIFLLEEQGLSVISDIDDTIKITEVRNKDATLRNTFLREFQAVPGMAEFYQSLARSNGAAFHYISASPWQLYEPLATFVRSNGFPAGPFELKAFRWKDRSFFSLFADPVPYKTGVIGPLLKQFPGRHFILIGDSGERDPEIYGALARQFPGQVVKIYIRDVTQEAADSNRYRTAFQAVPPDRWHLFGDPAEIRVAPR